MAECDRCNESYRKVEARQTTDGEEVCPNCAENLIECSDCLDLFEPEEEGQTICPNCRDDEEDEDDEDSGGDNESADRDPDARLKEQARRAPDIVAISDFYRLPRGSNKDDHLPRLRAEVIADLAAMDDAELTAWASTAFGSGLQRYREVIAEDELQRRLGVFVAELRRVVSA